MNRNEQVKIREIAIVSTQLNYQCVIPTK